MNTIEENVRRNQKVFYKTKCLPSGKDYNDGQQEKILQEIEELENSINGKKNKGMDLQTILIVGAVAVAIYFFFIKK